MSDLYSDAFVRHRLAEYVGEESNWQPTAAFVSQSDGCAYQRHNLQPARHLRWFLDRDLDIARSLADSDSLLLHLDVEYVNFDSPAEALMSPQRAFELQDPVVKAIQSLLDSWGIKPLHVLTGQGHHFVWRISRQSITAAKITALCPAPELLDGCVARAPTDDPVFSRDNQSSFSALSLLMEYIAHRARNMAAVLSALPVEITAVHVGPWLTRQRELVSIDISEYGDPLHTRMVRMPFTRYLKPWATGMTRLPGVGEALKPLTTIPVAGMELADALVLRHSEEAVISLAREVSTAIPCQEEGTARLLEDYLNSPLRSFHGDFYSCQHDPRENWPRTYGRTPVEALPNCVRHMALFPNDWLLKPAGIQLVTRCLLAEGWHARHIAGFIRSKFEDPAYHWGVDWRDYDPAIRADFYVRLFAGQHATGLDGLLDMNCVSTQAKGFCFQLGDGACGLESVRDRLRPRAVA